MTRTEVERVVERIRQGDLEAYAELVTAHQTEVWKVAAALLADLRQTEELVQQAFVQAYQQLDAFDPQREFGPWIKEIARNLARMEGRRRASEGRRLARYYQEVVLEWEGDGYGDRRPLEEALSECRQQLPEHLNRLLTLRYDQALSFGEIAEGLGRTVAATRQLVARVRLTLRDCIEKKGGFA